jgi:hypothetical protein
VVNRIGRSPRARAEITRAITGLGALDDTVLAGPVFVPERRHLDDGLVHAAPLPQLVTQPLASAVMALLDRLDDAPAPATTQQVPVPVAPGSLGSWSVLLDEPGGAA